MKQTKKGKNASRKKANFYRPSNNENIPKTLNKRKCFIIDKSTLNLLPMFLYGFPLYI